MTMQLTTIEAIMFAGTPLPPVSIEACGQAVEVINKAITRSKPKPLTAKQAALLQNSVYYVLTELALADRAQLKAINK